jgi:hypothetical protein
MLLLKKHIFIILLFFVQSFFQFIIADDTSSILEAEKIFEKVLQSRQEIRNGHFSLQCNLYNDTLKITPELQLDVVFSGDKTRIDRVYQGRRVFLCQNCYPNNTHILLNLSPRMMASDVNKSPNEELKQGKPYIVLYKKDSLKKNKYIIDSIDATILDVRTIGLLPISMMLSNDTSLEYYCSAFRHNQYIRNVIIENDNIMDVPCKKISFDHVSIPFDVYDESKNAIIKYTAITKRTFWISPNQDYLIRRAEFCSSIGLNTFIENEVKQDKKSSKWYTEKWTLRSEDEGKKQEEKVIIKIISINAPENDKVFDISQIKEFEPGTTVRWNMDSPPPAEGKLVWDGEKVVGLNEYKFGIATGGRETSRHMFIILVNIAGISAIIAIQCLRVWRRRYR